MKPVLSYFLSLLLLLLVSGLWLCGCAGSGAGPLARALASAGPNRSELEKAISYFDSTGDTMKSCAVRWLVENMPLHRGRDSAAVASRITCFLEYGAVRKEGRTGTDSITVAYRREGHAGGRGVEDLLSVDSAFIVDDIEAAFHARGRWPWAGAVRQMDFLEHVLPYRIADEPLTRGWRRELQARWSGRLDSLAAVPGMDDILTAANAIYRMLDTEGFEWTSDLPDGPRLGPAVTRMEYGGCQEFADRLVYVLRAAGIPAGCDRMMLRGDGNTPHSWAFVIGNDGETYIHVDDGFHPVQDRDFNFLKVFRDSYARSGDTSLIPGLRDVTGLYLPGEEVRLTVPADSLDVPVEPGDTLLLCSAAWLDWRPVATAILSRDGSSVSFGPVGRNCLVIIATRDPATGRPVPVSAPFRTGDSPVPRFICASSGSREVTLFRKYTPAIAEFADRLVGGLVEASDDPGFRHADTLLRITAEPYRLYTDVNVRAAPPRRYVRYRGPEGGYCNIAELELFTSPDGSIRLTGRPIGTPGSWGDDTTRTFRAVFDGDPYTSFDYIHPSGGWAGLDLGIPRQVTRIRYAPRNRDNFIREGDTYELYYWESRRDASRNGWVRGARIMATSDSLRVSVPEGTLYYLRNLTRGHDERIFTIDSETGLQRF